MIAISLMNQYYFFMLCGHITVLTHSSSYRYKMKMTIIESSTVMGNKCTSTELQEINIYLVYARVETMTKITCLNNNVSFSIYMLACDS